MRLDRGSVVFAAIAIVAAAVFIRLGFWQLDRLEVRRAANELRRDRLARPPVRVGPEAGLPPADSLAWRRAEARGVYDFGREVLLRSRTFQGRPGVELLTPLVLGEGPALLVLRGWIPAADGLRGDLLAARPSPDAGGGVTVRGILAPPPGPSEAEAIRFEVAGEEHPVLMRLDLEAADRALPYELAPLYLRATEPGASGEVLRTLPEPAMDEGPHLVYAIQWFAFAIVALVGAAVYLRLERRQPKRSG